MRTAVVVMSKIPQPGFTKTRLMSVLSEQESADFHRACLADTCLAIRKSGLPGYIYYAEPYPHLEQKYAAEDDAWQLSEEDRSYFEMQLQRGNELGERLFHAAQEKLTQYEAVVFLGSDMPLITSDIILEAQAKMYDHEIVLGPAQDGGYYLLGLKQAYPDIFQDIPWGTPQVLEKTLEIIRAKQFAFYLLKPQSDIDTWDDLKNFYYAGKSEENNYYRQLAGYQIGARLVEKYS